MGIDPDLEPILDKIRIDIAAAEKRATDRAAAASAAVVALRSDMDAAFVVYDERLVTIENELDGVPDPPIPLVAPQVTATVSGRASATVTASWSDVPGATGYQARIDTEAWTAAVSGRVFTSVGAGPHTVAVRAVRLSETGPQGVAAVTVLAPDPGPQPTDTISTLAQLEEAFGRSGTRYVVPGTTFVTTRRLTQVAGSVVVGVPDRLGRWTVDGRTVPNATAAVVRTSGELGDVIIRARDDGGDLGCLDLQGAPYVHAIDCVGAGGSAVQSYGSDDTPKVRGLVVLDWWGYVWYGQLDMDAVGFVCGLAKRGDDNVLHFYTEGGTLRDCNVDGWISWGDENSRIGGRDKIERLRIVGDVHNPGPQRTSALIAGYGNDRIDDGTYDLRAVGYDAGVLISGPHGKLSATVEGPGKAIETWGATGVVPVDAALSRKTLVAQARVYEWLPGRAFVVQWLGAPLPAGWVVDRVLRDNATMRVVEARRA